MRLCSCNSLWYLYVQAMTNSGSVEWVKTLFYVVYKVARSMIREVQRNVVLCMNLVLEKS